MIYIDLPFTTKLKNNLKKENFLIQVIIGPRQVGKTTTILKYLKDNYQPNEYLYVTADAIFSNSNSWIVENWHLARESNKLLIIDEIQKIENWSEIVKKLWDEDRKIGQKLNCIILGSSSLKIQKGHTESLAGRYQLIKVFHWDFVESQKAWGLNFEEYLRFGGYPGAYAFLDNQTEWVKYVKHSIIENVIEKDILTYHSVKSPALFKQAFEILISYPAQEISLSKLLGQLQNKGNTDLIKHYLSLFEGAFLIKSLEKYSNSALVKKSSSPKILPLCPAFYYLTILDKYSAPERGRVFELVVGMTLLRKDVELYYWREGNFEVDFVVKVGKKVFAIEVKSGRVKNVNGLDAFMDKFPDAKPLVITPENYLQLDNLF